MLDHDNRGAYFGGAFGIDCTELLGYSRIDGYAIYKVPSFAVWDFITEKGRESVSVISDEFAIYYNSLLTNFFPDKDPDFCFLKVSNERR